MVELIGTADALTAKIDGEIDHHSASKLRSLIDEAIQRELPMTLYLDFGGVTFMDSSGIGLIMGRYRSMQSIGGTVVVKNAGAQLLKVMRLAGLERLVRFQQ